MTQYVPFKFMEKLLVLLATHYLNQCYKNIFNLIFSPNCDLIQNVAKLTCPHSIECVANFKQRKSAFPPST